MLGGKSLMGVGRAVLLMLFTGLFHLGHGQSITGKVYDAISREILPGAAIQLRPSEQGSVADSQGVYHFKNLKPGRYTLIISHVGYTHRLVPNIWVRNGKITTQDIALSQAQTGLGEVVVRDKAIPVELGRMSITEEQINRFAATYYDPARVVTTSPDLAVTNDQNNRISVRGVSPNYNVWRLQGVEIVNPNHLSNAGTFTDQGIATGGSVNIISAQMLGNSQFLYGAFEAGYGNSVGGLFDMEMRDGNSQERQYTNQASLIGLDVSAEGPFSKNGRASYLVNYRYSFTGFLTNLGVDFGGESIGFQDFSMNLNLPLKDQAKLNVFATGGLNFNNFDARKPSNSEIQKDRSDIYFDGKMGAAGAAFKHNLGNGHARHSFAISGGQNTRLQNTYADSSQSLAGQNYSDQVNNLTSYHSRFVNRIGQGSLEYGVLFNYYQYLGSSFFNAFKVEQWLLNPHASFNYPILPRLKARVGVNYSLATAGEQSIDPRLGITWLVGEATEVYAKAGSYSQLLNPYNYYFVYSINAGDYIAPQANFNLQQSQRYNLGVSHQWLNWNLNLEGFYYRYPSVNVWDSLASKSEAETKGLSLLAHRNYANNWYITSGASLFNSTWKQGTAQLDNRYNTLYSINISTGKEWDFTKEGKERSLSVNGRVIYQGGLQEPLYTEADLVTPQPATAAITNNSDFLRIDLRVQWSWYSERFSSSLSLDLQNTTNRTNESYRYFDKLHRCSRIPVAAGSDTDSYLPGRILITLWISLNLCRAIHYCHLVLLGSIQLQLIHHESTYHQFFTVPHFCSFCILARQ
ncbi:MAG: TonB-dependent receptor [Owenweeksia sp.]|nr:TonB-dependent receptor [Owenweeksia sp.]